MKRFMLAVGRKVTAPTSSRLCFVATSSPASRVVTTAGNTTPNQPPRALKKGSLNLTSVSLIRLLTSVADDLQKNPRHVDARNNPTLTKADDVSDAAGAMDNKEKAAPVVSQMLSPVQLIDVISKYIHREEQLALLSSSKLPAVRRHYKQLRAQQPNLSSLQRDILFYEVSRAVERREVPLAAAARLLRPRWPDYFMDVTGSRHHAFLVRTIRVWVVELLQAGKLTASEARSLLIKCPRVFNGHVSLMGSVVECAMSDVKTVDDPEALIQLMWAVNSAQTHAPDHFWRRIVERLAVINRSLRDQVGNAILMEKNNCEKRKDEKVSAENRAVTGHVFSGLTTRQLFRILRVLRKERWCGDVSAVFDFVDKALKNIMFEAEAARAADENAQKRLLSRHAVALRVRRAADMSVIELLSLLSIAGDLGVDFRTSMARLSDYLLSPMVPHLNREQLFLLTTCIRQTRCDSPQLIQTVTDTVVRRGVASSCAIGLTKAALRTILQRPHLLSQLTLSPFVAHIFSICDTYKWSLRASQILGWVEVLYALSRRYAPSSSVGVQIRACVESFAAPLSAMLALGVVPISVVSRTLEHTVILGMRGQPQYPLTAKLWEERNALVNERNARRITAGSAASDHTQPQEHSTTDTAMSVADDDKSFFGEAARSVRQVYDDLIATYERQMIMRRPLLREEELRILHAFQHVGLYSLFLGADIMKQLHLREVVSPDHAAGSRRKVPLSRSLSAWIEREVSLIVEKRIQDAKLSPASTDDAVLRVLGHRHCDAAKVRHFQQIVRDSPLRWASQRRTLWEYIFELARRFGGEQEKAVAQQMLEKSFY